MDTAIELEQALHSQLQQQRQSLQEVEALLAVHVDDQDISQVKNKPLLEGSMKGCKSITCSCRTLSCSGHHPSRPGSAKSDLL